MSTLGTSERRADDRQFGAWLLFFLAVVVGSAVLILTNPGASRDSALVAVGLIVCQALLYWFIARPSRAGVRENSTRAWIYLALAVPLLIVAVALNPWANTAMFLLSPQIFILFRTRLASVLFFALNVVDLAAEIVPGPYTWNAIWPNVLITVGVIVIAIFFNARVSVISKESAERGALIEELRGKQEEIARLSEEQGRTAERVRIAREMHDTLAQGFTSIVTLGHAVQRELESDGDAARRHVELMTLTAQENLQESRRIIAALSPQHLEGSSLPDAIERVVDRFADQNGVTATIVLRGSPVSLVAAIDVVVLRVCQEALANIAKHAGAARVTIVLAYEVDELVLTVADDGAGFDQDEPTVGFGLAGMRSRLREVGGTVRVTSSPGSGTTVEARVPVSSFEGETE